MDVLGDVPAVVFVDGSLIEKDEWSSFFPKAESTVIAHALPQGSGNSTRDIARVIVIVAALVLTAYGYPVWGLAVNILGTLAINYLYPLEQEDGDRSIDRRPGLSGARNAIRPFQPLPRPLGKIRFVPPMAARPYNTTRGNEQYLNVLLCLGYEPLSVPNPVNNIRIGETLLSRIISDGGVVDWQIGTYEEISLFSDTVLQENINLSFSDKGDSFIRTADVGKKVGIELVWPAGLHHINENGRTREAYVQANIEFRQEGHSSWTRIENVSGVTYNGSFINFDYTEREQVCTTTNDTETCTWEVIDHHTFRAAASDRKTLRAYFEWPVPDSEANYEIRVTHRGDGGGKGRNRQSDFSWIRINAFRDGRPFKRSDVKLLALRVKASDQLNRTLDNVSVYVEAGFPTWDGSGFNGPVQPTNNPGEILRGVLTDQNATYKPIPANSPRLDDEAFGDLVDYCNEWDLTFNKVIESEDPMIDVLKSIAGAGRGSPSLLGDVYSVALDLPDQPPVTMFTPRNASRFTMNKKFAEMPDAFRIEFMNEGTWEQEERIVYNDGYDASNATRFEVIDLTRTGITNPDHVWQEGRYRLAQTKFRSENYSIRCGVENLRIERGRMVRIAWDNVAIGISFGRLVKLVRDESNNIVQIQLDEPVLMESGTEYALEVRNQYSDDVIIPIVNTGFETSVVEMETPQDYDVDPGDLFIFGVRGLTAVDAKVKAIRRADSSEMYADIDLVPAAPEIYDALTGEIPPYDPVITVQGDVTQLIPPKPIITSVRSDDSVIRFGNGGEPMLRIGVFFEFPLALGNGAVSVEARWRQQVTIDDEDEDVIFPDDDPTYNEWTYSELVDPDSGTFFIKDDVEQGDMFQLQLRSVSAWQQRSEWTTIIDHVVVGQLVPPEEVRGFGFEQRKFGTYLFWASNLEPDIERYEIRIGALFEESTVLQTIDSTNWEWELREAGTYALWIMAVNYAGLRSQPVELVVQVDAPSAVENLDFGYDGRFVNVTWVEPEAQFSLESYRVGYIDDFGIERDIASYKTTKASIDGDWVGIREIYVDPVDVAGNVGTRNTIQVELPNVNDVTGLTTSLEKFGIRVEWNGVTNREIRHYRIKFGDDFDTATVIQRAFITRWEWELRTKGTYTLWIQAVDVYGFVSPNPTKTEVVISGPDGVDPATASISFDGAYMILKWRSPDSDFNIDEYEIREQVDGSTYETSEVIELSKTTRFSNKANWTGSKTWWVTPIDVAGNPFSESDKKEIATALDVVVTPPNSVQNLVARSFDNNALLLWDSPESSTLPVESYEVRRGSVFDTADRVGFFDGTFANLFELESGQYNYWIQPIDSAGNVGEPRRTTVFIADPPDFVFRFDTELDLLDSEFDNIYFSEEGQGYLPREVSLTDTDWYVISSGTEQALQFDSGGVTQDALLTTDAGETWEDHWENRSQGVLAYDLSVVSGGAEEDLEFVSGGITYTAEVLSDQWSSIQNIIDAGYEYYLQPTYEADRAFIEKVVDYQTEVDSSTIRMLISDEVLDGDVNRIPEISYKQNEGDAWTSPAPGSSQITASSFRFVKYRLEYEITNDTSLVELESIRAVLDTKVRRDDGSAIANLSADSVLFNEDSSDQYGSANLEDGSLSNSTIEMWMRTDNLYDADDAFAQTGDQWEADRTLFKAEASDAEFSIRYNATMESIEFKWTATNQALGTAVNKLFEYPANDVIGLSWGEWMHFAVVLSDLQQEDTFEVYIEEKRVHTDSAGGYAQHTGGSMYLADDPNTAGEHTELRFNEVRIWKGVRSEAQILDDAERILADNPAPDLRGWWRFFEGSGTTVSDSSDNANALSLVNSPHWRAGRGDKVSFGVDYTDVDSITVSVNEETPITPVYRFIRRPNPEYFRFAVYDGETNERLDGVSISWAASGV